MPTVTEQDLINAKTDADTLETIVNGGPTQTVTTRLGRTINTVAKTLADMGNLAIPDAILALPALFADLITSTGNTSQRLYVSETNGNDNRDGITIATSVKTLGRALELMDITKIVTINLLSDITLDQSMTIARTPQRLDIQGRSTDDTSYITRRMTIVDAVGSTTKAGGFTILSGFGFYFRNIQFRQAHDKVSSVFDFRTGSYSGRLHDCRFSINATEVGADTGAVFRLADGANLFAHITNLTIDANSEHTLFTGIVAGQDPNTAFGLTTSITTV